MNLRTSIRHAVLVCALLGVPMLAHADFYLQGDGYAQGSESFTLTAPGFIAVNPVGAGGFVGKAGATNPPRITRAVVESYLNCKTKAHLRFWRRLHGLLNRRLRKHDAFPTFHGSGRFGRHPRRTALGGQDSPLGRFPAGHLGDHVRGRHLWRPERQQR